MRYRSFAGLITLVLAPLMVSSAPACAQGYSLALYPQSPTTESKLKLVVQEEYRDCHAITPNAVAINWNDRQIDISLNYFQTGFLCPGFISDIGINQEIDLGTPTFPGDYTVSVYQESEPGESGYFSEDKLRETFSFTIEAPRLQAYPETPVEGSVQSGIGVVRGWACDAWRVEVQFDDGPRRPVAYGTERTDTNTVCGDDNNGYGMVIAWGLLGKGDHTMRTYVNDEFVSEVNFKVSGLDEPFIEGLRGLYDFPDFPREGESTIVEWSEPAQNFIIIEQQ